jgi:tripartite-type tricarboxylate transporter receptor subunit TctC
LRRKHDIAARLAALAAACAAGFCSQGAAAQSVADFYRGKQIRLVSGHQAGSGIDVLLRTTVQHMSKHMPGNPGFIVQYMPGAGTRLAANWLYNLAPRDGLVIGSVTQNTPIDQAMKEEGVQFDVAKFNWIGNPQEINNIIVSWSASGLRTMDDVRTRGGLICGGSGGTSPSIVTPQIVKNLTGANIQIVAGYGGNADVFLAMERGEVNCVGASSLPSMRVNFANQMREHKISILLQVGIDKDPAVFDYEKHEVPLIADLATNDLDRKVLNFINIAIPVGRPLFTPPGVPRDRVEALRKAFDETMKDKDYLADAEKNRVDINPVSGARLQELAIDVAQTPENVVARAKELSSVRDVAKRQK